MSRRTLIALPLSAALLVGACGPAQNGGVDNADPPASLVSADSRVTMERLACYGTCPVYTVDIAAGGSVMWTGERHVDSIGTMSHRIEPRAAAELMQSLQAGGFFELADKYTYKQAACGPYHTDAPRVNLTLRVGGRSKTVEHDYGCGNAPAILRVLQTRVDSVAGVSRYIGNR